MPRNQFQRMVFTFLTVVVTVHAYVVINGTVLMNITGADRVILLYELVSIIEFS